MRYARSIAIVMLAPIAVGAADLVSLAGTITNIINTATGALVVVAIVIYFWSLARNINKFSEEGAEKVRSHFFWGVIIFCIIFTVWGIVNLLKNSIFPT